MQRPFFGHLIVKAIKNGEWLPISYLYDKFEQNGSINGRHTFKGHCGLCILLKNITLVSVSVLMKIKSLMKIAATV